MVNISLLCPHWKTENIFVDLINKEKEYFSLYEGMSEGRSQENIFNVKTWNYWSEYVVKIETLNVSEEIMINVRKTPKL